MAKGYRGGQSKLFRTATERVNRALRYAKHDRRLRKRDFRSLWIARINAAAKNLGISYSRFIKGLKDLNIIIDRKMLSELAIAKPEVFEHIVNAVKGKQAA
jgi:large subunit ribosomal protein L20